MHWPAGAGGGGGGGSSAEASGADSINAARRGRRGRFMVVGPPGSAGGWCETYAFWTGDARGLLPAPAHESTARKATYSRRRQRDVLQVGDGQGQGVGGVG